MIRRTIDECREGKKLKENASVAYDVGRYLYQFPKVRVRDANNLFPPPRNVRSRVRWASFVMPAVRIEFGQRYN